MTKHFNILLCAVLTISLALSLSGCGSKGQVVRADDYDAETIVDLMNEEDPVVNPVHPKKPQTTPKKPVVASPLDGEWFIVKVANKQINADTDIPYVIFSDAEGRFYAFNGCNYINGEFEYNSSSSTLKFSQVVTTLRDCPDITYLKDISTVLNEGVTLKTKIENRDQESYLYLYTNGNEPLMTLCRHNVDALNGQWEVESIGSMEVDGSEINIFIDIPERSVHGNTGCNYFNGAILIDPDVPSSISFSQMGVTMKYCDNADTERKLLVALEETDAYSLKGKDTLYLNDSQGNRLITLKRK